MHLCTFMNGDIYKALMNVHWESLGCASGLFALVQRLFLQAPQTKPWGFVICMTNPFNLRGNPISSGFSSPSLGHPLGTNLYLFRSQKAYINSWSVDVNTNRQG